MSTASNESPLPFEPSSTNIYTWRPSTILGSSGSWNLPTHHPHTSPLSCFIRIWNPLFFFVFHYRPFFVCTVLSMATFCFNHLHVDKIKLPVKLVQFSSVSFFFSPSILHFLEVDRLFYVRYLFQNDAFAVGQIKGMSIFSPAYQNNSNMGLVRPYVDVTRK